MSVANALSDFLHGNPFTTQIGSLVEESTEDFVGPELCQLFSQVCGAINRSPSGPKDAIRAIRRRFTSSLSSNETVAMHTLLLLENCMLNCGYRFHVVVASREVLRDLTKCLGLTSDSSALSQKVLSLIQSWAMQFSSQVDLQEFGNTYKELRARGIKFPPPIEPKSTLTMASIAAASPAHVSSNAGDTTFTSDSSSVPTSGEGHSLPQTQSVSPRVIRSNPPIDRSQKLQADLAQVRINVCVLSDMLTELETEPHPSDEFKLLLSDLAQALFEMNKRLIQAISCWEAYQDSLPNRTTSDAVLLDLLNVNDELHTVLMRYGRLVRPEQKPIPVAASGEEPAVTLTNQTPLQKTSSDQLKSSEGHGCSNPAFVTNPWESRFEYASFVNDGVTDSASSTQNNHAGITTNSGASSAVPLLAPGATEDTASKDVKLIEF